ncbi:TPA: hypothetical protein MM056_000898 [Klebsiella pneumoniae]|uniref:hypothetical protein n=1 Tax=Klebsiella pneumoniae complex TaxID=3390273 RepID=UPI00100A0BF5|nr:MULTISPECIES: hypothetical protein [Klebsiella]MBC4481651.1 hypothetical protein [Klebsiella pneumoniae]MBC5558263.1 hypothetical protein [Klebsiella pneumoniae]MCP6529545.1 hypothetical protein [Klebsiella pneumoniae]QAX05780.1 hypothetical protein C2M18_13375 [Klebsiella pneumoniae]HBR6350829.1 hypothetical protein [Klebsiella pneumoniae]
MAMYIRKVAKSKWNSSVKVANDALPLVQGTDGVTNCCKTYKNTISLWMIDGPDLSSENDKKIIAALGSNAGNLSFVDYVILTDEELETRKLSLENYPGDTFIDDIRDLHYNITNLDMTAISTLGLLIKRKVAGVLDSSGETMEKPTVSRIAENLVKSYIYKYIPKGSEAAAKLSLKPGFKDFYA